jgi:thiamine monophosphate synthase
MAKGKNSKKEVKVLATANSLTGKPTVAIGGKKVK